MTYNAEIFNRAAALYDELPPFFRVLGEKLVDFADLPVASSVLDIGAGKGAVTLPALTAVGPSGTVTALEVAGQMIQFLEALASGPLGDCWCRRADVNNPTWFNS